jgi:hypothetical protein
MENKVILLKAKLASLIDMACAVVKEYLNFCENRAKSYSHGLDDAILLAIVTV